MKIINIFLIVFFIQISKAQSQIIKSVEELEIKYQKCLDAGANMLNCSKNFYFSTDSILNIVYNRLKEQLPKSQKSELIKEQVTWLKTRDNYFNTQNIFHKKDKGLEGTDLQMVVINDKANFVMKRVKVLINRLKK
jgi:uncharacterized protein YecT (DUF1311 family)